MAEPATLAPTENTVEVETPLPPSVVDPIEARRVPDPDPKRTADSAPPLPQLASTDPAPPKVEPPSADEIIEQRLRRSEDDLRRELLAIPELRPVSDAEVRKVRAAEHAAQRQNRRGPERASSDYAFNLRLHQAMKQAAVQSGLSLRSELNCRLDTNTAAIVAELSKNLRDLGFVSVPGGPPARRRVRARKEEKPQDKQQAFQAWCDRNKLERFSGTLPTLLQMLQVEGVPTRLLLVRELDRIKSAGSTAALAGRAMMDLSPEVRAAAVAALQTRPPAAYVPILLQGLRYPWPPVADHAAVALRELAPNGAVPRLLELLDQPDPSAPILEEPTGEYLVRELVRLNHLRNCLLCHAPSANKNDGLVRGLVPTPGQSLPVQYYESQTGDFVRADITYLHQDFSYVLPDKESHPWPEEQRFDFVTRLRRIPLDQTTASVKTPGGYPQREAVLYALRGLTGKDGGDSSDEWRKMLGFVVGAKEKTKDVSLDNISTPAKDGKEALDKSITSPKGKNHKP
jgi:hypothetical protein